MTDGRVVGGAGVVVAEESVEVLGVYVCVSGVVSVWCSSSSSESSSSSDKPKAASSSGSGSAASRDRESLRRGA